MQIPIKYKKRMFEAHQSTWTRLLADAAPISDFGRGKTNSNQIPNLGHTRLEDILLQKYRRKFCVFTNCATDALDFTVACVEADAWYVPSYTWYSPVNAIAKSGKEVRFLDVHPETRMVNFENYDPAYPVIIPHVDGVAVPKPPVRGAFMLEDAAQSPLAPEANYGDAIILSFGSSKRLGLLGQGGCLLTDDEGLAGRMKKLTMFGLNADQTLAEPGFKSFFDPYNALCTQEIIRMYAETGALARVDALITAYNEAAGIRNPSGLERYSIQVSDREKFRARMDERGIETRVWIKTHAARHAAYGKIRTRFADRLPVSDLVDRRSVDVPLNEYLSDEEVEKICAALRESRDLIQRFG